MKLFTLLGQYFAKNPLLIGSNNKLQFRDTGIFIRSGADGKLTISADGTGTDDVTIDGSVTITGDLAVNGKISGDASTVMAPGAGFAGTGTLYYTSVEKSGDFIKTTIFIDLTGAASSTTDLDIIGTSGVSHIGQILAAVNGTLFYGRITCLETPAGGIADIDIYSATEGTGAFDGGIAALEETAMLTKGGNWTAAAATQISLTTVPAAGKYMYLTGGAGGTAATYTAGQFLIELFGV
jgi:hypothetical protein